MKFMKKQESNQRSSERLRINLLIEYQRKKQQHFNFCRDLSEGGLFIETDYPLPTGETVQMSFTFPHNGLVFRIDGKVMWVRKKNTKDQVPAGMGIQFAQIAEHDRQVLKEYLHYYLNY